MLNRVALGTAWHRRGFCCIGPTQNMIDPDDTNRLELDSTPKVPNLAFAPTLNALCHIAENAQLILFWFWLWIWVIQIMRSMFGILTTMCAVPIHLPRFMASIWWLHYFIGFPAPFSPGLHQLLYFKASSRVDFPPRTCIPMKSCMSQF